MAEVRTLDFGAENLPFGNIVGGIEKGRRYLVWPVLAYRVTIPSPDAEVNDGLNAFERVMLKLITEAGIRTEQKLQAETFLPPALIRAVVNRLRDRGLIDGYLEPTPEALKRAASGTAQFIAAPFVTAQVFREAVGGKILPFIHIVDFDNPIATKLVAVGDETNSLIENSLSLRSETPQPNQVLAAMRGTPHQLPQLSQIRVSGDPVKYYLACPIAFRNYDGDYRIASPFGYGYAPMLEDLYENLLVNDGKQKQWLKGWNRYLNSIVEDQTATQHHQPFATRENQARYPGLIRALTPHKKRDFRNITQIYSALEYALFYSTFNSDYDPQLAIELLKLRLQNAATYSDWLASLAVDMGFTVPSFGFRLFPPGKFVDYQNGQPELDTVLAIALVQASNDATHRLHLLANHRPDFLEQLNDTRNFRNPESHGQNRNRPSDLELSLDPMLREVVSLLFPTIKFGKSQNSHTENGTNSEFMFITMSSIFDELDRTVVNALDQDVRNSLIACEQHFLVFADNDDALPFVQEASATVEAALRAFLRQHRAVEIPPADYFSRAEAAALNAGFAGIPAVLRTANVDGISKALQQRGASIGAAAIAVALATPPQKLHQLADAAPKLFEIVGELHQKRGHLVVAVPMSQPEVAALRGEVFKLIKVLSEVSEGN